MVTCLLSGFCVVSLCLLVCGFDDLGCNDKSLGLVIGDCCLTRINGMFLYFRNCILVFGLWVVFGFVVLS